MFKRIVSGIVLMFLLTGMSTLILSTKPVSAYRSPNFPYPGTTHQFIFEQARTILRNDGYVSYADFLDSIELSSGLTYLEIMKKASDENDGLIAAMEHYMDPMDHKGFGGGLSKSAGTVCQERFDEALVHWQNGDYYNATYDLGWAAHLVQDLCVPHHAWTTAFDWHSEYEGYVDSSKESFAVSSGGIYSFTSFPDRQYYPTYNSDPSSNAYWHYNGENPTAYDWVDYNAHESIKYFPRVDGNNDSSVWLTDSASPFIETVHNLQNSFESDWVIAQEGYWIRLYFEKIDMQTGYDYIELYSDYGTLLDTFTGNYTNPFWTDWYGSGQTLKIKVITDSSVPSWGYKITQVQYGSILDYPDYVTNILLPRAQRTTAGFIKFFFDKVPWISPEEPHPGNAMWIEPSSINLTNKNIGYRFNVTVWINLTAVPDPGNEVGAWQFVIIYEKDYLNVTRAGYTAGDMSQWFRKAGVTSISSSQPYWESFNDTHNYIMFGEVWSEGSKVPEGTFGSLSWIEFNITAIPTQAVSGKISFVTTGIRRCKIMDETGSDIAYAFTFHSAEYILQRRAGPWDVNADGIVDIEDIYLIALAYGTMPGQPGYKPNLDINSDSIIDIEDIYIAALHYGETDP